MSAAQLDDVDLRLASREIATAREELRRAHAILETRQRREAMKAAIARLELAARTIELVIERCTPTNVGGNHGR